MRTAIILPLMCLVAIVIAGCGTTLSLHSFGGMSNKYCCGECNQQIGWGGGVQAVLPTSTDECALGALEFYNPRGDLLKIVVKIDGITIYEGLDHNYFWDDDYNLTKEGHYAYTPLIETTLSCGNHTYFISRDYNDEWSEYDGEQSGSWCIEDATCLGACDEESDDGGDDGNDDDGEDDNDGGDGDGGGDHGLIILTIAILLLLFLSLIFSLISFIMIKKH